MNGTGGNHDTIPYGGGDPRFHELLEQMRILHNRKSADYGKRGVDPLANFHAAAEFGVPPWLYATTRLNEKITRLKSLAVNKELKNESADESFLDIANLAVLALVLYREGVKGG